MSIRRAATPGVAFLAVLVLGFLLFGGDARSQTGPSVQVKAGAPVSAAGKTTIELTIDVSGLDWEDPAARWKDIHIWPPESPQHPPPELPNMDKQDVSVNCGSCAEGHKWEATRTKSAVNSNSSGIHIVPKDANSSGLANGHFKLSLTFKAKGFNAEQLKNARVVLTKNGNVNYTAGEILPGGVVEVQNFPVLGMAMLDNGVAPPILCSIGATTPLALQISTPCTEYVGTEYVVYSALSLNEECEDELGIGINSETDPVPASWGLQFGNFTGTIGEDGRAVLSPTISVPPDPSLSGRSFYVLFGLLDEDGVIMWICSPVRVVIP